jgi:hypothetical protein
MRHLPTACVLAPALLAARGQAVDGVVCDAFLQVSFVCTLLTVLDGGGGESIMELMAAAIEASDVPDDTVYDDHANVFCMGSRDTIYIPGVGPISIGGFSSGGVCAFPEGAPMTLGRVKELTEVMLRSGCDSCGNVLADYPENADGSGGARLKFDYRTDASCFDSCIITIGDDDEDDGENEEEDGDDGPETSGSYVPPSSTVVAPETSVVFVTSNVVPTPTPTPTLTPSSTPATSDWDEPPATTLVYVTSSVPIDPDVVQQVPVTIVVPGVSSQIEGVVEVTGTAAVVLTVEVPGISEPPVVTVGGGSNPGVVTLDDPDATAIFGAGKHSSGTRCYYASPDLLTRSLQTTTMVPAIAGVLSTPR